MNLLLKEIMKVPQKVDIVLLPRSLFQTFIQSGGQTEANHAFQLMLNETC